MATTLKPVDVLKVGIRDTAGAVVASGKARFYEPGTLTERTVYQDDAAATPFTQPVTLNAAGQATVYTLEATRMIVKDSTETTTYYDGIVNLQRHDSVYITATGFNSGNETTLETVLGTANTSFGGGFQYKPTGGTAMNVGDWMSQLVVNVKAFGAVGNGSTDDVTAIQAAIDFVEGQGGGTVWFPEGTYKITSDLTIDTAGVSLRGVAPGVSIIKNFSTTASAITFNLGSALDAKAVFENFSITADSTSSGTAILVSNGDEIRINNVHVGLHRTGFDVDAVTDAVLTACVVESTDNNASAVGFSLGSYGKAVNCTATASSVSGTGFVLGAADCSAVGCVADTFTAGFTLSGLDSNASDCKTISCTTGFTLSGAPAYATRCRASTSTTGFLLSSASASAVQCRALGTTTTGFSMTGTAAGCDGCVATSATTGFSLGAANAYATRSRATGATTGFSIGAVANCDVSHSTGSSNTTDINVNASATNLSAFGTSFSPVTNTAGSWAEGDGRMSINIDTDGAASPSWTPPSNSQFVIHGYRSGYGGGGASLTIGAVSTTGVQTNDRLHILLGAGGAGAMSTTWNSLYKGYIGTNAPGTSVTASTAVHYVFRYTGSEYRLINQSVGMVT